MLETFRNAAKGWVAKLFMGLLVLSFAIWGINDVGTSLTTSIARWTGFGPQDLAKVGDVVVSSEQFRNDLNNDLQRLAQQSGTNLSLEDARRLGIDKQVLDRIINSAVIDSKVESLGLSVSDNTIVADVAANPAFQTDGVFDPARFRSLLQQNGLDEANFMASEKLQRRRSAVLDVASDGITLPRTLTEAVLRYRNEKRDARYFSFSVSETDVPAATSEDLKKQYEANPPAYTAPEYRSIAVIKVEPADVAVKIALTEEEITQGYEKHKGDFYTPEKRTILQLSFADIAKADAAKRRLDAGEDFMKLATEFGAKESDVTFADRSKADFLDAKIADAAFALSPDAVSPPVQGDLTIAILKAAKVSPEVQKSLAEVRDGLVKTLQLERARDEIQSVFDAVEDARAQQTKFEDIAAKAGIPFTMVPAISSAGVSRDGTNVTLTSKDEVLKAAFASDVGVENDALSLQDGYIWYEVREVIPSALRPLDDVKDQVTRDYVANKLRSLASDKAKALVAKGATLEVLAAEASAAIKTVKGVKRNDVSEEFDGAAALALFAAPAQSLNWSLEGDGKSARIIEVSSVDTPAFSAASADTKAVADEVKQGLSADSLDVFLKSARTTVPVDINEALWAGIRGGTADPQ